MTTSSPALAVLTALPPVGKSASNNAGTGAHKTARQAAETGIDPAATEGADTPEDSPNFAKMLRDQTGAEQAAEQSPGSAVSAKADPQTDTAEVPAATPQTSEQLSAWLASLMRAPSALKHPGPEKGHPEVPLQRQERAQAQKQAQAPLPPDTEPSPETQDSGAVRGSPEGLENADMAAQQAQAQAQALSIALGANQAPRATAPTGAEQLARVAGQAGSASALTARGDTKAALARSAAKPTEKSEAPDERAANRAPMASAREAAKATLEGSGPHAAPAASVGQKSLAAGAAVPEASAALKSNVQRPATGDLNTLTTTLTGMTPTATTPPSSPAAVVDTTVAQDIRRPEFVPSFSARIATLVQEGVEQARVHLNPVDMGPVSLQLSLDGLQVRVDMTAEVATTRQVLEQAMPALAGALREAGFTLSGGGVSPPADAAQAGNQDPRGTGSAPGDPQPQGSAASGGLAGQASDGRRSPEAEPGRTLSSAGSSTAEVMGTELHMDDQGRPRLAPGRGLVDTFA